MRQICHQYTDPLDRIWSTTAQRVGLELARSSEVYASTDGRGTLHLGAAGSLDADDCLAQMVFHELCHSLIEGPEAFTRPDWGLDNTGPRDEVREHACLRLQALLAAEYGLREVLAPTTDFRVYYDKLGADPMTPRSQPSVPLAIIGWQRVDRLPWAPHVRLALRATADVAGAVGPFAMSEVDSDPCAGHRSLWSVVQPPLERHPLGFAVPSQGGQDRTCGTCTWHYVGGRGRPVDRCRQADGARIDPNWPGCLRWETALDCQACGACCREAYHSVTVARRDPAAARHPDLVVDRGSYVEMCRIDTATGTRCAALSGGTGPDDPFRCVIYDDRPRSCREFAKSSAHCLTARRRVGLSR